MVKIFSDYNLKHLNTFGIDAKCEIFVEFDSLDDIPQVLDFIRVTSKPFLILGGGSNLVLKGDFNGVVLHPVIEGIETRECGRDVLVRAGCGVVWDELVEYCVGRDWHGLENLSLIPGVVGASAVQNIGAYGVEAKDVICKVEAIEISTGQHVTFDNEECCFSYRHSRFKDDWHNGYIITYVTFRLSRDFCPNIDYGNIKKELSIRGIDGAPTARQLRNVIIGIRQSKLPDPKVEGNAGSFFMNPVVGKDKFLELIECYPQMPHYAVDDNHEKVPAGWLIEQCGWKGRSLGRAGVYEKQALVLVNRGGATGDEVVELCNAIRNDVRDKFGIDIKPEANIV